MLKDKSSNLSFCYPVAICLVSICYPFAIPSFCYPIAIRIGFSPQEKRERGGERDSKSWEAKPMFKIFTLMPVLTHFVLFLLLLYLHIHFIILHVYQFNQTRANKLYQIKWHKLEPFMAFFCRYCAVICLCLKNNIFFLSWKKVAWKMIFHRNQEIDQRSQ